MGLDEFAHGFKRGLWFLFSSVSLAIIEPNEHRIKLAGLYGLLIPLAEILDCGTVG